VVNAVNQEREADYIAEKDKLLFLQSASLEPYSADVAPHISTA